MKTAVITGAASGLGKAIALHYSNPTLAGEPWQIIIADIQDAEGQKVANEINSNGGSAQYFHCDISKPSDFEELAKYTEDATGRCDLMVNCAGIASAGSLMSTDEEQWQKLISLDLMSVIWGSKAFIPLLKKTAKPDAHAAIINIASFAGIALMPGMMTYNVTKAGVIAFSETLRCELFKSNIHVGVSCPSFFKTNLTNSMSDVDEATLERINRWMENSGVTAADVAADIANAVTNKEFMILSHKETKKMYRISRWFPNYLRKQKTKIKMF
jgi:NAD(P)-dependent dehydrogenase (short-subunit alcohol dehydrogenase family)